MQFAQAVLATLMRGAPQWEGALRVSRGRFGGFFCSVCAASAVGLCEAVVCGGGLAAD